MAQYVIINNIDNYDDVCIICHGELKSNYLQCTCCNKICHQKCINNWFAMRKTCPVCRSLVDNNFKKIDNNLKNEFYIIFYLMIETIFLQFCFPIILFMILLVFFFTYPISLLFLFFLCFVIRLFDCCILLVSDK